MTASPAPLRIVIGENNGDLAASLAALIDLQPDLRCVGQASTTGGVLKLAECERPDAYVLDLTLDDGSAIPLIRTLRARQPGCAIIVFTGLGDPRLAEQCRAAGCDATLQKNGQVRALLASLREQDPRRRGSPT
jgi:DNA-binding NarL/FixJ family response regulator